MTAPLPGGVAVPPWRWTLAPLLPSRAPAALVALALAGCGPGPCPALPGPHPVDRGPATAGPDWDAFEAFVVDELAAACVPGLSLSLVDAQGTHYAAGFGWASLEDETPVTVDTPFMVASASKMVAGLALALAHDEGALRLSDPVARHVDFPVDNPRTGRRAPPIRLHHLATHSSGIRDNWAILDQTYRDGDPRVPLGRFLAGYLRPGGRWSARSRNWHRWAPGEAWMYSNVGAALAAHAVAQATGERYAALTHRRLFAPLGMDHSAWFLADLETMGPGGGPLVPATPYTFDADGGWSPVAHYGFPTWPDGQLRSSAADMGRLLTVVLARGTVDGAAVLSPGAVRTLLSQPVSGLGAWYLDEIFLAQRVFWFDMALDGRRLTGHDGDDLGVSSEVFYDRQSRVGVALVMNLADGERDGDPRAATAAIQHRLLAIGESL